MGGFGAIRAPTRPKQKRGLSLRSVLFFYTQKNARISLASIRTCFSLACSSSFSISLSSSFFMSSSPFSGMTSP
uniref:Uncharacterized protein n=1 Tax=Myoviridae sp. ctWiL39 TaxID=2825120 RepID=A0A8S5PXS1_9CAUD|nr:MAG TPA: hypothetical protein [Myoviridae sp. ctWiL39]